MHSIHTHGRTPYEMRSQGRVPKGKMKVACVLCNAEHFQGAEPGGTYPSASGTLCLIGRVASPANARRPPGHPPLRLVSVLTRPHPGSHAPPPTTALKPGRSWAKLGPISQVSTPLRSQQPHTNQSETPRCQARPGLRPTPPRLGALCCAGASLGPRSGTQPAGASSAVCFSGGCHP